MAITLEQATEVIRFCSTWNIKRFKLGEFEVEFYQKAAEGMALDPVSLSKTLSESMPPDSAMLFAATEDPVLTGEEA